MALASLVIYVFAFVSLLALRKMKRWAYYTFGVITLINLLVLVATPYDINQRLEVIVGLVFMAYLWTLRKRFV